jgi:N6-L-threonylcarbamoyladenine synthase
VFRPGIPIADLAASFQQAVVEPLAVKTARAAARTKARTVVLAGGVAANSALRDAVRSEVSRLCGDEVTVSIPPLAYCTDNAAMVAGAGYFALRRGDQAGWETDIHPRLSLTG